MTRRLLVVVALLGLGCVAPAAPIDPPPPPTITTLTPRTGSSGEEYWVDMVLVGRRFDPIANTVRVTPHPHTVAPYMTLLDVPSERGGTRITLDLPKCVGDGGPCFLLGIGNYDVTVTTATGESNVAPFTLCVPWLSATDCLAWGESL